MRLAALLCVAIILGTFSESSAQFNVRLISPGGTSGESYRPGNSVDIVYETAPSAITPRPRYRFEFSTSSSGPWSPIAGLTNVVDSNASGSVRAGRVIGGWRVPATPTATGYIRQVLIVDPNRTSVNANPFTIVQPQTTNIDEFLVGSVGSGQTRTLSRGKIYGIKGYFHVDNGGTLVVEPGTVVVGDEVGVNSALVINRGGKIIAAGRADAPIVFTSIAPPGQREPGDWGGVIILGRARINNPGGEAAMEGGVADPNNRSRWYYGGDDDNDNSGILQFVRIEFGGIALQPNQELNGLTMGGVGKGTTIHHVQVSFANDDAFEWFGGTVDAKHIISMACLDDDFDCDNGFSGRVQFAVSQRYPTRADQSTSQTFEIDNDASGSFRTPRTRPIFSNVTSVGPLQSTSDTPNSRFGSAAQLRRGSLASIYNTVFLGWPRGMEIAQAPTMAAAYGDTMHVRNTSWFGVKNSWLNFAGGTPPSGMTTDWLSTVRFNNFNDPGNSPNNALLENPFGTTTFSPIPLSGSPVLSGATFTREGSVAIDDSFFERVAFRGAFGDVRWDAYWANYDPVNAIYIAGYPTVANGSLRMISPNGGDNLISGTVRDLTWDTLGTRGLSYKFQFSTNPNGPWTDIAGAENVVDDGATRGKLVNGFRVPNTPTLNAYVRMVSIRPDGSLIQEAQAIAGPFTIVSASLAYPSGGEKFRVASKQNLVWDIQPSGLVSKDYSVRFEFASSPSGPWQPIAGAENVKDDGDQRIDGVWQLPNTPVETGYIRMTILDGSGAVTSVMSMNSTPFSVVGLTLIAPAAESVLETGMKYDIVWDTTSTRGSRFKFQYRAGTTGPWTDIAGAENVLDDGATRGIIAKGFTAPAVATTQGYIRMSLLDDKGQSINQVFAQNSTPFTIKADTPLEFTLRLISPGGSPDERYRPGRSIDIRYDTVGGYRNRYRFEFGASESGPWTPIINNVVDSNVSSSRRRGLLVGAFLVPPVETTTGYIRMTLLSDETKTALSPYPFSIIRPKPSNVDSVITGPITGRVYLANTKIYGLRGYVHVDNGGVLVIQPGTIIFGDSIGKNCALVVNRGGKIIAKGTPELPIVMTSIAPPGQREAGDWGGLCIFGNARINNPGGEAAMEGGVADANNKSRWYYGGNDDDDSSGVLSYVRVEFAGLALQPNQELNGITMGGVGRRTAFDHVQVSYSNDDGFEWFGGTVNAKHIVSVGSLDDDFDCDNGFSGKVQFGIAQRYPSRADQSTSQSFEIDNDGSGSFNKPMTTPLFSNITAIGPLSDISQTPNSRFGAGAQIRRNARASIFNSVFAGWPRGIEIAQTSTMTALLGDTLQLRNNAFYGLKSSFLNFAGGAVPSGLTTSWLEKAEYGNAVDLSSPSVAMMERPFEPVEFNPALRASSPLLSGAGFDRLGDVAIDDSYFERVVFRGAMGMQRWDLPWTEYDPINAEYKAQLPSSVQEGNAGVAFNASVSPNPTQGMFAVRYELKNTEQVSIRLFDSYGRNVATLFANETQQYGVYEFRLNTAELPSGLYFVNIATGNNAINLPVSVLH